MPHLHRFYIEPGADAGLLTGDEAHHALHVARVRPGDAVALFDGKGREVLGTVATTFRHEVGIEIAEERCVSPPEIDVWLLQAWLVRDKSIESLIRRGTDLGVTRFRFFEGNHSGRAPKCTDKWRRLAIESCKQCGRAWLPEFEARDTLADALADAPAPRLLATGDAQPVPLRTVLQDRPHAVTLIVGPEGDFTEEEIQTAQDHGAVPVSLGANTYRSEVAGTLLASLVLYELGQLGPMP